MPVALEGTLPVISNMASRNKQTNTLGQTLESILVDVSDGGEGKAKGGADGPLQHHAGILPENPVLVHVDVDRPAVVFGAVEVERGAHDQVIPTGTTGGGKQAKCY